MLSEQHRAIIPEPAPGRDQEPDAPISPHEILRCAQDDSLQGICHPERSEGSEAHASSRSDSRSLADLWAITSKKLKHQFVSVYTNFHCRVCFIQCYPYYYRRIIYDAF